MANRSARSIEDIEQQIKKLKEQIKKTQARKSERFAKIATDAGLLDLDISDEDLRKAFDEIAVRFRASTAPSN